MGAGESNCAEAPDVVDVDGAGADEGDGVGSGITRNEDGLGYCDATMERAEESSTGGDDDYQGYVLGVVHKTFPPTLVSHSRSRSMHGDCCC